MRKLKNLKRSHKTSPLDRYMDGKLYQTEDLRLERLNTKVHPSPSPSKGLERKLRSKLMDSFEDFEKVQWVQNRNVLRDESIEHDLPKL